MAPEADAAPPTAVLLAPDAFAPGPTDTPPTLLAWIPPLVIAVDSDARLSFVVLNPVESDAIPLCDVLKPVDSDETLLLVVLSPVDRELTLLFVELSPVDNELRPLCVVDSALAVEVDNEASARVTAFICDPFTASVDVAEIRPAATLTICRSAPGAPTLTTLVGRPPANEYV